MTAYVEVPSYLRVRRRFDARRSATFIAIGAVHIAALAVLFMPRHAEAPVQSIQPMMVTFVSEDPPRPEPPPPPPPEPVKPKPQPKMIATPKPTPAAITAPPIEEPPVEAPPVQEQPPPSPPVPAAPAETIPPNFVAAYLNNPAPKYPPTSKAMREQGTVMLLVLVNAEGRAEKVTVDASSGHGRLDDAAVDVVRHFWRFVPARQGDKTVSAWVKVPIKFELHQR